jgi:hypothetical protein
MCYTVILEQEADGGYVALGGHPKPTNEGRLKTGQRN